VSDSKAAALLVSGTRKPKQYPTECKFSGLRNAS